MMDSPEAMGTVPHHHPRAGFRRIPRRGNITSTDPGLHVQVLGQ